MNIKILKIIQNLLIVFLSIFGLFIVYQIILKIFGGSWETEDIIIAVLFFNVGLTITIALNQAKYNIDYNYFKRDIYCFVRDFKEHMSKDN